MKTPTNTTIQESTAHGRASRAYGRASRAYVRVSRAYVRVSRAYVHVWFVRLQELAELAAS